MSKHVRAILFGCALVGVGMIALAQIAFRGDQGYLLDFYPLYRGAQALLDSGDAYDLAHLQQPGLGVSLVGNAYPIHAVLLLGLPFAWLPPGLAVVSWTLAVGLAWIMAVRWADESPYWLLWLPMWQALLIQQPSAALGAAAVGALGAMRRGNPWVLAVCIALLAAKPQQFLVLGLALAWGARAYWRQMAIVWGTIAAVAFAAQPDWIARWLERVDVRAELIPVTWFGWVVIPLAAILAMRGWRESSLAVASTGIAPWPSVGGYYMAVAWPLGVGHRQAAAFATFGIFGFIAGEMSGASTLVFVAFVGVGMAIAAIGLQGRGGASAPPSAQGTSNERA